MVYPLPIELAEDGLILIKTILTGWALVMLGKGIFEGLVFVLEYAQQFFTHRIKSITDTAAMYKRENLQSDLKFVTEQ